MEPDEAAPDLVGRTSARLLAAGVDRRERLDALHLLAILDASTDVDGRVRRPLDDLAGEFDLHPLDVIRSLEHLEHAGAVERDGGSVIVLGAGSGLGGLQLADFLDDVRSSFDADLAPLTLERPPARARWLSRAGAGLVAVAAAASVITLAPSSTPAPVQPLAVGSSTTAVPEPQIDATGTTELVAELPPTTADTSAPVPGTEVAPPPVDTTVLAAETCPTATPMAEVIEDIVRITNPFDHDISVSLLNVGGITITSPITIVAGGSVDWPLVATLTDAAPIVSEWEYTDPSVSRTCPS